MTLALTLDKNLVTSGWKSVPQQEWRALRNWLLVWVIFANTGFAMMYFIGSPSRLPEIIIFGVVGLIVRGRSYAFQVTSFILVMVYSILAFIAGLFNLAIASLAQSLMFSMELNFGASFEYMVAGGTIFALTGGACWAMRRPTNFIDLRLVILAVAATASMALVDHLSSMGMRGHYKRVAVAGAPFTSAVEQSGLIPAVGEPERNLMIVVVESLGAPVGNEEMSKLLFAEYNDQKVQSLFAVTRGETTYYNSTTAGEIRELCGRWGDYYELVDTLDSTCLPAKMAARGFGTWAFHSFDGDFFERSSWYPNIGFEHSVFRDELVRNGSAMCGGVFPGACDRDVPRQLAQHLKNSDTPQLVYWLTVNTHLPVPLDHNLGVNDCSRVSPTLAREFPMICRQFALWQATDRALIQEITAPDFPPTDILLVGDHMPPYYDRHNRSQFAPDRVPWLLLKWRGDSSAPVAHVAERRGVASTGRNS